MTTNVSRGTINKTNLMDKVILNQERTLKQYILGGVLLFISAFPLLGGAFIVSIVFILIGLITIGFYLQYEITKDFNNKKHITVFGLKLISLKLDFPFPDYNSLFAATFSGSNEYGAISSLGHSSKHYKFTVKFFKGNKHVTVYTSNNYQDAYNEGNFLRDLLDVELYNSIEENNE